MFVGQIMATHLQNQQNFKSHLRPPIIQLSKSSNLGHKAQKFSSLAHENFGHPSLNQHSPFLHSTSFLCPFYPYPSTLPSGSCFLSLKISTLSLCSSRKIQDNLIDFLYLDPIASTTKENKRSHPHHEALLKKSHQETPNLQDTSGVLVMISQINGFLWVIWLLRFSCHFSLMMIGITVTCFE